MVALIIQYTFATACLLFVVSLPIWSLSIGAKLRRIAGALFLAAVMPSLFFGLLTSSPSPGDDGSGAAEAPNALELLGAFVLLSVVSYAILEIRKRMKKTSKDAWSEFVSLRSSGKRPVSDARTAHTPTLFDEEPGP
jgi:hypothetical protein